MNKKTPFFLAIIIMLLLNYCASSKSNTSTSSTDNREAQKQQDLDDRQQLLATLNLTPEQKPEVEAILKNSQEQMEAIKNGSGNRQFKRQQIRSLSEETTQKLSAILDAYQMRAYKTYLQRQRLRMQQRTRRIQ